MKSSSSPPAYLSFGFAAYAAASLFHYAHNATFLADYPGLPAWLSGLQIYGAWLAVMILGLIGLTLVRRGSRIAGPAVLAVYGLIGLDGLAHYAVAPPSAHTLMMNASIVGEAATAIALLAAIAWSVVSREPAAEPS
jgi:hypothetical protein